MCNQGIGEIASTGGCPIHGCGASCLLRWVLVEGFVDGWWSTLEEGGSLASCIKLYIEEITGHGLSAAFSMRETCPGRSDEERFELGAAESTARGPLHRHGDPAHELTLRVISGDPPAIPTGAPHAALCVNAKTVREAVLLARVDPYPAVADLPAGRSKS